jgi:hypothetical protein
MVLLVVQVVLVLVLVVLVLVVLLCWSVVLPCLGLGVVTAAPGRARPGRALACRWAGGGHPSWAARSPSRSPSGSSFT